MIRLFAILLAIATLAATEGPPAKVRLLVIGNSFSGCATDFLPGVAKSAGCRLEFTHLMIGGSSLEVHWTKAAAALADPADPQGRYPKGSLPEVLAQGPWDAVTIQQYSGTANDAATYRPFADRLVALIRERSPGSRIYLHETWAYRCDDPRFASKKDDPATMHEQVHAAYASVAKDLDLAVIPVGAAFALLSGDPAWAFSPEPGWDAKAAQWPALPDQAHSLHVGWYWTPAKKLLYDGHHANDNGKYLGACVWLETFCKRSAVGIAYRPKGMGEPVATMLQDAAHRAVLAHQAGR